MLFRSMFSNGGGDTLGNVVGSESKIKSVINDLDKDGRLKLIFGEKGAQQMRDARDLALDLYTSPSGTVQGSNNAGLIINAINKAADIGGGVPVVGSALKYIAKKAESNALSRKVSDSLNQNQLNNKGNP